MIMYILYVLALLSALCIVPTAWLVYKKRINFFSGVFLGTFLFLMSFGCVVYGFKIVNGYSPIDDFLNSFFESIKLIISTAGVIPENGLQAAFKLIEEAKNLYITLLPSMIVMSLLSWAYIFMMISKGVFAIFKRDVSGFRKFSELKMPKSALFVAAIAFIGSSIMGDGKFGYVLMNFSSIILSLTTVCGLSFIDFKFREKVKFSVLRIVIYFILITILNFILGDASGLFLFVGMFDAVFDFRRRNQKTDNEN